MVSMGKKIAFLSFLLFGVQLANTQTPESLNRQFLLDYRAIDQQYANMNGHQIERGFQEIDDDDSAQQLVWVAAVFDTIIDFYSNSIYPYNSYPLSSVQLTIDSLWLFTPHFSTPGNYDTIRIKIFDATSISYNIDTGIQGTPLWDTTIITDSSLVQIGGVTGGVLNPLTFAPALTLNQGKGFAVQIQNSGDSLFIEYAYRDACNGYCIAAPNVVKPYVQGAIHFGAVKSFITDVFFDCDQSGSFTPSSCENYHFQHVGIYAQVSATMELAAIAGSDVSGCYGDTIELNAWSNVSSSGTIVWQPGSIFTDSTAIHTSLIIPQDSTQVFLTVIESSDTSRDTMSLFVSQLVVSAGSDTVTECELPVQLNGIYSGSNNIGSIVWRPGDGLSDSTLLTPIANPDSSVAYTLIVTDSVFECVVKDDVLITKLPCTGLDDISELDFNLWPNPNSGRFIIENVGFECNSIQLYDRSCKTVWQEVRRINPFQIEEMDFVNLPEGVYVLELKYEAGTIRKLLAIY